MKKIKELVPIKLSETLKTIFPDVSGIFQIEMNYLKLFGGDDIFIWAYMIEEANKIVIDQGLEGKIRYISPDGVYLMDENILKYQSIAQEILEKAIDLAIEKRGKENQGFWKNVKLE